MFHPDRPVRAHPDQTLVAAVTEIEVQRASVREVGLAELIGFDDEGLRQTIQRAGEKLPQRVPARPVSLRVSPVSHSGRARLLGWLRLPVRGYLRDGEAGGVKTTR